MNTTTEEMPPASQPLRWITTRSDSGAMVEKLEGSQIPGIPTCQDLPPGAVPLEIFGSELRDLPEAAALQAAAKAEFELSEAARKFSREAANADHEAAAECLRKSIAAPGAVDRLKELPSLEERMRSYDQHAAGIYAEIKKIRRAACGDLEAVTAFLVARFLERAAEARSAIDAEFSKWNLPAPGFESVEGRFCANARWLASNYETAARPGVSGGMAFAAFLRRVGFSGS